MVQIDTNYMKTKLASFLEFCQKELDLPHIPKIFMVKKISDKEQPTFAFYNINNNSITVAYQHRHILDIMRSLAHELVHAQQHLQGDLDHNSGDTGSDQENQANSVAGVIMRKWGKTNPDLFSQ